MPSQMIFEGHW